VDRAGHSEPAQEQGDEREQAQVTAEPAQGLAHRLAVFGHGAQADALGREEAPVTVGQRLGPALRRHLEIRFVAGPRAELQQARAREVGQRHVDARAHGRAQPDVPGHVEHEAADGQARLAQRERVAHARVEGGQQRGIDEHAAATGEAGPGAGRVRGDHSVEGIPRLHGRDLHQARP
jgi:hypothetical protein